MGWFNHQPGDIDVDFSSWKAIAGHSSGAQEAGGCHNLRFGCVGKRLSKLSMLLV